MANPSGRPLSPHLTIWKWGPHMLVSILHRVTGDGLAIVGALTLLWFLVALATGPEAFQAFKDCMTSIPGMIVLIGLTWAFFEHMFSGLRHLVLDTGAGYQLQINKFWSVVIVIAAPVATALFWGYIYLERLAA